MNRDNFETEKDILEAAEESHEEADYKTAEEMGLKSSEERIEEMQRNQDTPDYVTIEEQERARIEAMIRDELTPAEVKAAKARGQTATEFARAELGVAGKIEAMVNNGWGSDAFKDNQIRAEMPAKNNRRGNETAEFVMTADEIEEAKDAGISAVDFVSREYDLDATKYTKHSLQDTISDIRTERAEKKELRDAKRRDLGLKRGANE